MRRLWIFILLGLSLNSNAQGWMTLRDSSVFDGITNTAGVMGKSNDKTFTSPKFLITNNLQKDIFYIYLMDMPYGGCQTGFYPIKIKFDGEEETYQLGVTYSEAQIIYNLIFVSDRTMKNRPNLHLLSAAALIKKLKTKNTMYLRYQSTCVVIDIEFPLAGAEDALQTLLE